MFTVDKNNLKLNKGFSLFGDYNKQDVSLASNVSSESDLKVLVDGFNALQQSADSLGSESYTNFLSEVRNESEALADSMTTLAAASSTAKMSMDDAFNATYGGTTGLSNVRKLVESYNALGDGTNKQTANQKALVEQISKTNKGFGSYISGLDGAKASISGYGAQLVAAKVKTIALTAASTALNAAISFGVSIAISAIISGITSLVNAQEEARKKAVESSKAYEDQKKQIEELKNKYIEIMDSEKDEATKAKELDTIKNTLAETYGVEKEALDKLNESRQEGLDLMDEEAESDLNKYLNDNKAAYDKAVNEFDNPYGDSFTKSSELFSFESIADVKKNYEEVFEELSNFGIIGSYNEGSKTQWMTFGNDAKESYDNIEKALTFFNDKERTGAALTLEEKGVIEQLNKSKKNLEDRFFNDENGTYSLIKTYTESLWNSYEKEFIKDGHKALEDIDNLVDLEDWIDTFLAKNAGLMGNNPYLGTYLLDTVFANKRKEIQKASGTTEQSITYPTISVKELNDTLDETSEKLEKITSSASKVQSALKSAFSKESFSIDDVLSLIELMPDIADKFKMNDDGTFSINYEDLQSGAESYIETQKQEIDTTNELIKAKIKELEANIALNKSRLLTNSKGDYEYNQNIKSAIATDEDNLASLKNQLSEGLVKSDYLAKASQDLSASFSAVVDVLTDRYEVITDVEDAIADNGSISLDSLNKIKDVYPELSDEVSNYIMGLIDEQSLLSKLRDAYDNDFYTYRDTIAQKIDLTDEELQSYLNALNTKYAQDEAYYSHLGATSKNFIDYMKDNYAVDLDNCKTWCDAKLQMQTQTMAKVKALAAGINIEDYYNFETGKKISDWSELYAANGSTSGLAASGVLGEINNILSTYGEGIKEFGALFKSTSTLDGVANKSGGSKSKSTKSTTEEVFDWIEVRLTRLADKTKSFFDKVSDYVSNVTNERNLGKAINSTQNEINANKKAEQKYRAKANSINLSENWKKKVREGDFSIDELTDESLIKNIQDYQKWWEKAEESAQNIATLTEQRKDYQAQQFNSRLERQQRVTTKYSNASQKQNDVISMKQTKGKNVTASDYKTANKYFNDQNKSLAKENKLLGEQQNKVAKGSKEWQNLNDQIQSNNSTIRQNNQSVAENNKLIAEMPLNRAITKADNAGHEVTYQQGTIDDKNTSGKKVTAKDYDNLNKAISSENSALREQRKELVKLRDSTDKGSDAWNDYNSQLQSVDENIQSNTTQIKENNNKKFDVKIADYDDKVDKYQNSISDSQGKLDLRTAQGKKNSEYYYKQMISASKEQNKVLGYEKKAIEAEMKTTQKGSERWRTLNSNLQSVNEQINQNKISQAEWNATIRNIPIDRINEYLEIAEAIVSHTKSYIDKLSYINGESSIHPEQIYSQMYTSENLSKQVELRDKYYSEYKKANKEGRTKDTEEYQKLYLQADSTYNEMLKTNEELRRQGRDISLYRSYEQDLQHIEDVKKAMSSLSGMLNDDALYNDDGSFSEQGIAKIALTIKNLETARKSAKDYKNEIDVLNKAYKQGKYNKDEYAEKLRELAEGYQGATSEINQYAEAIKDLYKNQAQEELNALNKLIEARSNALQKKKE